LDPNSFDHNALHAPLANQFAYWWTSFVPVVLNEGR